MLRLKKQSKAKSAHVAGNAQATIEFIFCMIIVFVMMYTTVRVFRWTGIDLVERRIRHDQVLKNRKILGRKETYHQITPNFYKPLPMNATFGYDVLD